MDFKELVVKALEPALACQLDAAAIKSLIEHPNHQT